MDLQQALHETNFNFTKDKAGKFDLSRKQLRSFYREFNNSLLIIGDTPKSYLIKTKNYGTFNISKEYSITDGLFLRFIDTWYLLNIMRGITGAGEYRKQTACPLEVLSAAPTR